jgi:hypothetical protein
MASQGACPMGKNLLSCNFLADRENFRLSILMQETVDKKRIGFKTKRNKGKSYATFLQAFRRQRSFSAPQSSVKWPYSAAAIFTAGRSVFLRSAGTAFLTASRTIRRCTPNFRAIPITEPTPNSYSPRICSYSSTLALQSNSPSVPQHRIDSNVPASPHRADLSLLDHRLGRTECHA